MTIEEKIKTILLQGTSLIEIEPHIYSTSAHEEKAFYDEFGGIYETVACNRFYNRLIWGYWISEFHRLCSDVLASAKDEWVLDAGCGSLAFSAKAYIQHMSRPTVFLDPSIRMLRLAKSRLMGLNGSIADNMLFLLGDTTRLPFKDSSIGSVISMNVLHAVKDASSMMLQLKRVMAETGSLSLTTLVKTNRLADRYIDKLGAMGAMVPRSLEHIIEIFNETGIPVGYLTKGNMAFVHHGREIDYFRTGQGGSKN